MKKNLNCVLWGAFLLGTVAYTPITWAGGEVGEAALDTVKSQAISTAVNTGVGLAKQGIKAGANFATTAAKKGISQGASAAAGSFNLSDLNPFKGCKLGLGTLTGGGAPYHTPILGYTFDVGSAASRILSTAVKYFLSDDTDLVAELVWKKKGKCGGCGGCYGGKPQCNADLKFAAVFNDISVESDIYRDGVSVETECVPNLAQDRLDDCVVDQASLDQVDAYAWKTRFLAQRRSIQALTDALNMKRLYGTIKDIATSIPDDYNDYSAAMSTVASKRLLLDQLLALKKQVVAARVRLRAQTLELGGVDLRKVTTSPDLTLICKAGDAGAQIQERPEGGAQ